MGFRKLSGFNNSTKENRKNSRYPIDALAQITYGPFQNEQKTVDISASGFSIKNPLPTELTGKSLKVRLKYTTSSGQVLTAEAQCRLASQSHTRLEVIDPIDAFQGFLDSIWG